MKECFHPGFIIPRLNQFFLFPPDSSSAPQFSLQMTGNSFKYIELFFPGGGSVEIKCYSLALPSSTAVAHKDDNFNVSANLKIRIKKRTSNSVLLRASTPFSWCEGVRSTGEVTTLVC